MRLTKCFKANAISPEMQEQVTARIEKLNEGFAQPSISEYRELAVEVLTQMMEQQQMLLSDLQKQVPAPQENKARHYKLVRLQNEGDFADESDAMGHNVRGYEKRALLRAAPGQPPQGGDEGNTAYGAGGWQAIQKDQARVYSLRDAETNERFATIELEKSQWEGETYGWDITQIKGPRNSKPIVTVWPMLQEFVQKGEWVNAYDLANIGLKSLTDIESDPDFGWAEEVADPLAKDVIAPEMQKLYGTKYVTLEGYHTAKQKIILSLVPQSIETLETYLRQERKLTQIDVEIVEEQLQILRNPQKQLDLVGLRPITQAVRSAYIRRTSGLKWDKVEGAEEEQEQVRQTTSALRRVGFALKDSTWAAKAINFASNLRYSVLQIQQLAHTSDDPGIQVFNRYMEQLTALKNQMMEPGKEVVEQWEALPKHYIELFNKLIEDNFWSGQHLAELTSKVQVERGKAVTRYEFVETPELLKELHERGVKLDTEDGQNVLALYLAYHNSFLKHIAHMEREAIEAIRVRYSTNQAMVRIKAAEVREAAELWRRTPYLARTHYGRFWIKVYNMTGRSKQVVYQEHFESVVDQTQKVKELQAKFGPELVAFGEKSETDTITLSLPTEFIHTLKDTGEFTEGQLESIADATLKQTTDKVFSKMARDATRIAGTSPDLIRNYANFIEDNANFTSKLAYGRKMLQATAWTKSQAEEAAKRGNVDQAKQLNDLANTMRRARELIISPKAEYFKLRSYIALSMLLYAPKTAMMNLSGLVQAGNALGYEYGEAKGVELFGKAFKDAFKGKMENADEQWMIEQAYLDGVIDQGFGYYMSGIANSGNLARSIRTNAIGKGVRLFVDTGMWMFKAVESLNRKTTLLGFFRGEYARLLAELPPVTGPLARSTHEELRGRAYELAKQRTKLLQNDYTSGNRPSVFHGKQSLAMIFLSYPQYMLWLLSGSYERGVRKDVRAAGHTPRNAAMGFTMKAWLMLALLAGYEGVPFGATMQDLIQWLWNKFGKGDNIKLEAQKMLKDTLGIESAYWRGVVQHGLLYDMGGVNLSGSYSMGYPLPGTRFISALNSGPMNTDEFIGRFATELSGPFGAVVHGTSGMLASDSMRLRDFASNMVGAPGALARAAVAQQEKLADRQGGRMLRDEQGNARDPNAWEIAAIAAGFSLTEVAKLREKTAVERDITIYWTNRRLQLKERFWQSIRNQDPKEQAEIEQEIDAYNKQIPYPALYLSGKEKNSYVSEHRRGVVKSEVGQVPRRSQAIHQDVGQAFSGN